MSEIIRKFYEKAHTMPELIESKITRFRHNPDIELEFEKWIKTKSFETEEPVVVEGHTAKELSELSPYISGEGAFVLLLELRENPKRAQKRISNGFKMM